jgi:hypothetical protein
MLSKTSDFSLELFYLKNSNNENLMISSKFLSRNMNYSSSLISTNNYDICHVFLSEKQNISLVSLDGFSESDLLMRSIK